MLGVVVAAGLADPPRRLVGRLAGAHQSWSISDAAGVGLEPGDVPGLAVHRREERRVQRVDVDVVALVRPGADPLELGLGLGEPGARGARRRRGRSRPGPRSSRARGTPPASATGRGSTSSYQPAARPRSRRRTGWPGGGPGVAARLGHGAVDERALEREAGVLPLEQPARVAPDVRDSRAARGRGTGRRSRGSRRASSRRRPRRRGGPPRRARRACRSGASPGCAWRRTPSG